MTIGVILAGGRGLRFGLDKPKQFNPLAGRPIMDYAIETLSAHAEITQLVVTYPEGFFDQTEAVVAPYRRVKPITLVQGGSTRPASTRAALAALPAGRHKVLFHDGVRPFVTADIITRTISALDGHDGADVVIETADTIVQLGDGGDVLSRIPDRTSLRRGQTPQGFWTDDLRSAYEAMDDEGLSRFTDDCGVLLAHRPEARIAAVQGSERNIKITHPIDMFLAEQLLYLGQTQHEGLEKIYDSPVAVVLGDASGLGRVVRERLESLGWRVFGGSRATGVDVRDQASVIRRFDEVAVEAGKIDLIANFAGTLHVGRLDAADFLAIDEVISTNLMGSIHVARASYDHLTKSGGHLMLCSSSSYFRGRRDTAAYSASKAAVVNLTQALAEEWAEDGIVVSCLVPRRADTPMRQKAFPDENPALRMKPARLADAVEQLLRHPQSGLIKHVN
ncbi:SDR family NAD(P)-dependent oxidoreductase [Brevundimonas sp.]|uniref:SDR family NAD(P)-dependent oxidoreductase n=1 Tax=Brevundimonas sp. TaxID=1871086 RepID=UPI003BA87D9A